MGYLSIIEIGEVLINFPLVTLHLDLKSEHINMFVPLDTPFCFGFIAFFLVGLWSEIKLFKGKWSRNGLILPSKFLFVG